MTANVITYRGRSAAREVGKALGFDASADRSAREGDEQLRVHRSGRHAAAASGVGRPRSATADRVRQFARLWNEMQDLPRHLGQHSGGMVICQGQLDAVVPLENASMPGRVVVQWDKDDCADMGIVKVDLLGLGMMAVIQDALATGQSSGFWNHRSGESAIRNPQSLIWPIFLRTPRCLRDARRRRHHRRLPGRIARADGDAAAAQADDASTTSSSRWRSSGPGRSSGRWCIPYLNRRAGREPITYPHPSLEPILKRTLGVPLFQEQLLRMAMVAAGFTGGQAEDLRRAMGFKRSEKRMKQIEVQLREGMARNGITGDAAEADHHLDRVVRAVRISRIARRELRAAGLCQRVSQGALSRRRSTPRSSTTSRWGFITRRRSSRTRSAAASGFIRSTCRYRTGTARSNPTAAFDLGLRYVAGLREQIGKTIAASRPRSAGPRGRVEREAPADRGGKPRGDKARAFPDGACPKCGCDDPSMLEPVKGSRWFCNTCSHDWDRSAGADRSAKAFALQDAIDDDPKAFALQTRIDDGRPRRFARSTISSARTGLRRDEVVTLADIGALNGFGYDRRSALRQAERAVRPSGELFVERTAGSDEDPNASCPLRPMIEAERLVADYAGTGLTVGRHPMALGATNCRCAASCGPRSSRNPPGPTRARRRHGHHAPAAGDGQGLRVPHARGRNRHRQHHRATGSLCRSDRLTVIVKSRFSSSTACCRTRTGSLRFAPNRSTGCAASTSISTPTTSIDPARCHHVAGDDKMDVLRR